MPNINNYHQPMAQEQYNLDHDLNNSLPTIEIVKSTHYQISKQAKALSLADRLGVGHELDATSISNRSEKKQLLEQEDFKGETAIYHVIMDNNLKALKLLLQCGANVFHKNKIQQSAIDLAYHNRSWSCFLALIKAGSMFPKDFNLDFVPIEQFELWNIIKNKNKILELIATGNLTEVRALTEEGSLTASFMDIYNQSAIIIAFNKQKYEIFVFLRSRGFNEHWNESPVNIHQLSSLEKSILKSAMASFVKPL